MGQELARVFRPSSLIEIAGRSGRYEALDPWANRHRDHVLLEPLIIANPGVAARSEHVDEDVFDDPYKFNILRDPNPHVGFGGTGAHYCIGANLAKMTINLIFNAVADNMPDLKPIATPERLRSGWLNGIKHWQVDYTGKCPVAH